MQDGKKGLITTIVVLVIVVVGGYFLLTTGGEPTSEDQTSATTERTPEPTLAPQLRLTPQEKAGDVSGKKAEILKLVRSGKALRPEEKSEIGGIMLTKAHIYNFSEDERVDIFEALQR
jgi:hypothetical protein